MYKKMLALLLAGIITISLAACGNSTQQPQGAPAITPVTTDDPAAAIDTLLTRDYIVCYLWYSDGLQTEGDPTADQYYAVSAQSGYTSMNDLRTLAEGTYTVDLAASLTDVADAQGRARFIEQDGKLYKSAFPVLSHQYWDYDASSVSILSRQDNIVTFTVQMKPVTGDGSGKSKAVEMRMRRDNGTWQLCKVSVLAAEGGEVETIPPTPRDIAGQFITALRQNDTAAIAALTGDDPGLYSSWKKLGISAAITATEEEYDGYGRYKVHMTSSGGESAPFGTGESDRILIVSSDNDTGEPLVSYFEPAGEVAYNFSAEKSDPACEMALRFLRAEGFVTFKSNFWLDAGVATDFVLTELYASQPQQSYTEEEIKKAAASLLGYEDFTPDETYHGDDGFILPGRAPKSLGELLIWPSHTESGNTTVQVVSYSDRLHTQKKASYLFTFRINEDGSRRLISVV